jgi:hypothetical protein
MTHDLMMPLNSRVESSPQVVQFSNWLQFHLAWCNKDVFSMINSLVTIPSWMLDCLLHEFLIIILSFFDVFQI